MTVTTPWFGIPELPRRRVPRTALSTHSTVDPVMLLERCGPGWCRFCGSLCTLVTHDFVGV